MRTIEAVYEGGVLRPLEPLALPEGARVSVSLPEDGGTGERTSASMLVEFAPGERTPAEILAEIAAMSVEHGGVENASEEHDKYLYGWERKK